MKTTCKFCSAICIFAICTKLVASADFEAFVTNALTKKSFPVEDSFTNRVNQCANQNTNEELSITAKLIMGVSQLEMFNQTLNETHISTAFNSVSNLMSMSALTTKRWEYWHLQLLHVSCMNVDNNKWGAYFVSSNAWDAIQGSGFYDSTNIVSQALMRYYGFENDVTIRTSIALFKALSAAAIGKNDDVDDSEKYLPDVLKQKMRSFLNE